ncbi:MAG: S26 family signal peptidase [Alphaproteobacteria bacterium]|nr:S26 family signal peptidase [Alphaproteobacteria bacterium]
MTRFGWVIATYVAAIGAATSVFLHPLPRLIWNASASVPIGLYAVHPAHKLNITELVVVRPPADLARYLAERRYLPEGVPMLKRVLALPGQTVCRSDRTITVDGIGMGDALERDTLGRPLPVWQGCQRIPENCVFLMNWQSADSFDGRYFGLLSRATVLGRADPVWTQEED